LKNVVNPWYPTETSVTSLTRTRLQLYKDPVATLSHRGASLYVAVNVWPDLAIHHFPEYAVSRGDGTAAPGGI